MYKDKFIFAQLVEFMDTRKHKGGIKIHTLYDIEAQVPAFVHITEAKAHDSKAMPKIPYESGAHYTSVH